ncbi:MAG: glycosyltransferase family 4 protein [Cytophagales bacterium]|nr:glycosyltransferase family 4 protein [Cytophagales bacterium]
MARWLPNYQGELVLAYTGALGKINHVPLLVKLALEAKRRSLPICFLICGEGSMSDFLQDAVQQHHLDHVRVHPMLSTAQVREVLAVSHLALVPFVDLQVMEHASPNKLFDALAAGKPVATTLGGWLAQELESQQAGFTFASADDFFIVCPGLAQLDTMAPVPWLWPKSTMPKTSCWLG